MDWTVDYTFAGTPSDSDLMMLQIELDDHLDVSVAAIPNTGQWTISFGITADRPEHALDEANHYLEKFGIHDEIAAVEILTIDELERRADTPTMPVLVGSSEIAEMLGVSRQRVHQLRVNPTFPAPLVEVAMGPLWDERAVAKFGRDWERKPGRPTHVASA